MKKFCFLVLYFFFLPIYTYGQVYPKNFFRSPVDIKVAIAGTFGELRKNHFHSGIDIKTKQKINIPIYAIQDGYVSRIKVSSFGFGKTSCIKAIANKLNRHELEINLANIKILRGINEGIDGLKEIRVLGHEKYFLNIVHKGASLMKKYYSIHQMIMTSPRYLLELTMVVFLVLFVISLIYFMFR